MDDQEFAEMLEGEKFDLGMFLGMQSPTYDYLGGELSLSDSAYGTLSNGYSVNGPDNTLWFRATGLTLAYSNALKGLAVLFRSA